MLLQDRAAPQRDCPAAYKGQGFVSAQLQLQCLCKHVPSNETNPQLLAIPYADDAMGTQPEPLAKQAAFKPPEAIIVRPAASSLPRILCNKAIAGSRHTQQQQPSLQTDAFSQSGAGSKRKAITQLQQTLPKQRSESHTPSADEATPVTHIYAVAVLDCPAGAAQRQPPVPALSKQDKKQTTSNAVTSGEQPHFTIKRQSGVKTAQPSSFSVQWFVDLNYCFVS